MNRRNHFPSPGGGGPGRGRAASFTTFPPPDLPPPEGGDGPKKAPADGSLFFFLCFCFPSSVRRPKGNRGSSRRRGRKVPPWSCRSHPRTTRPLLGRIRTGRSVFRRRRRIRGTRLRARRKTSGATRRCGCSFCIDTRKVASLLLPPDKLSRSPQRAERTNNISTRPAFCQGATSRLRVMAKRRRER